MKKRFTIFLSISIFLFGALFNAYSLSAQAAGCQFPFDEFNTESGNLEIEVGSDNSLSDRYGWKDYGYMGMFEFGYYGMDSNGNDVFTQTGTVTIPYPENMDITISDKYNKNDDYVALWSHDQYDDYGPDAIVLEPNNISWHIFHTIDKVDIYDNYDGTSQQTIDQCVKGITEDAEDYYYDDENMSVNPIYVIDDENGCTVITEMFVDKVEYFEDDYDDPFHENGGFFANYVLEQTYHKFYAPPELPDIVIYVRYEVDIAIRAQINRISQQVYLDELQDARDTINYFNSLNLAPTIIDIDDKLDINWDDPVTSSYTPGATGTKPNSNVHVTTGAATDAGEDEGTSIPGGVVAGVLVVGGGIIAGGTIAGTKKKKRRNNGSLRNNGYQPGGAYPATGYQQAGAYPANTGYQQNGAYPANAGYTQPGAYPPAGYPQQPIAPGQPQYPQQPQPQQPQNPQQETPQEQEKKQYKMYIQKDFGDSIRRGDKPVIVRARIGEIDSKGVCRDRDDLTARIETVSGSGMTIHSAALVGRYCEAQVSVPADYSKDTADVTFTYVGEGGTFRNTVRFKVIGDPKFVFLEGEGLDIRYNGEVCRMKMIEGDGITYSLYFTIKDCLTEPSISDMYGENKDGFTARFEKAPEAFTYIAHITNNTPKKHEGVFFKAEETFTHLYVRQGEGIEPLVGSIYVTLVPQGLTVSTREIQDGFMLVDTNKDESAAGLDPEIRPVGFTTNLAYTVDTATGPRSYIAENSDYEVEFGDITGPADYISAFRKAFKYQIDTRFESAKDFSLEPLVVLPQKDKPYEIEIPIYATHRGNSFGVKLPVRLLGEKPTVPSEWDKEWELMKRALQRYGLSENEHLRWFVRNAKSLTAHELFIVRRAIIEEAVAYYTAEANEFTSLDQSLGRYEFTFSCVKWILDQAFSVIATQLYTAYGEAFLSPLKDMIGEFLGELTANAYWGKGPAKLTWESVGKTALKGCENSLGNLIDDAITYKNTKKFGVALAGLLFLTYIEKFYFDQEASGDIYKSLTATFNDLAANTVKIVFSKKFSSTVLGNSKLHKEIQNYFIKDFIKRFPDRSVGIGLPVKIATDTAMKYVEKYVTETLGLTATFIVTNLESVHEKTVDRIYQGQSDLNAIEVMHQGGMISESEAITRAGRVAYRTLENIGAKDMYDIDLQIGDTALRINILDNLEAIAAFIWNNTLGLLLPEDMKIQPVTDCPVYVKK